MNTSLAILFMFALIVAAIGVILYFIFSPRMAGIRFRRRVVEKNPDNINLGNMGYYLSIGDEKRAEDEFKMYLEMKTRKICGSTTC